MQIMPINTTNLQKPTTPSDTLAKELGAAKNRLYMNMYKNKFLAKDQQQFHGKLRHDMTVLNLCESLQLEGRHIADRLTKEIKPELKKQAEDRLRHITSILKEQLSKLDVNKEVLEAGIKDMLSKISKVH